MATQDAYDKQYKPRNPYQRYPKLTLGDGPVPCDLMVIGDMPSADDIKHNRPFAGKVGKELQRYIWHSCSRHHTSYYVTNFIKNRMPNDEEPTDADIAQASIDMCKEIAHVNPVWIVSVGRLPTRYLLGDVDMDWVHGIVHIRGRRIVVPCVHPGAGLHNTEFQAKIAWDFAQLGKLLRNHDDIAWETCDPFQVTNYREATVCHGLGKLAAVDTEGSVSKPWCVSVSNNSGTATMLRTNHNKRKHITISPRTKLILHNALHDIPVLRVMGARDFQFDDTMIMAYLLGVEPQGLKALAKRHCGMDMQDYQDLMYRASRDKAEHYIRKVLAWLNKQYISAPNESSMTGSRSRKRISANAGKRSSRTVSRKK
jgi:uracil-DNA glycosylase family 4